MTIEEGERELKEWHRMDALFRKFDYLCRQHVTHAREKHPFFAERVLNDSEKGDVLDEIVMLQMAQRYKRRIAENPTLENVLLSEVYEFLAEAHKGDMVRAIEEAADVFAVLFRFLAGDIKNDQES